MIGTATDLSISSSNGDGKRKGPTKLNKKTPPKPDESLFGKVKDGIRKVFKFTRIIK